MAVDATSGTVTRLTGTLPAPRGKATAAYSPARRLVDLFGRTTGLPTSRDGAVLAIDRVDGATRVVNASLPAVNAAAVTHPVSGQIWIFGGWQGGDPLNPASLATVWRFDPESETVNPATFSLPAANHALSVVASRLTGKISFMSGGLIGVPPVSRRSPR